jgi:large subunit ribosomal protein L24
MRKIRKGDKVRVISGNDRGREGEVVRVYSKAQRIIVKGVGMITKHQRPTQRQREGGIIEREGTIPLANVLVICPECDRPTRVGFIIEETGEKLRLCKQCQRSFT